MLLTSVGLVQTSLNFGPEGCHNGSSCVLVVFVQSYISVHDILKRHFLFLVAHKNLVGWNWFDKKMENKIWTPGTYIRITTSPKRFCITSRLLLLWHQIGHFFHAELFWLMPLLWIIFLWYRLKCWLSEARSTWWSWVPHSRVIYSNAWNIDGFTYLWQKPTRTCTGLVEVCQQNKT